MCHPVNRSLVFGLDQNIKIQNFVAMRFVTYNDEMEHASRFLALLKDVALFAKSTGERDITAHGKFYQINDKSHFRKFMS